MAQSRSSKKLFNMAYGLGASIVILGALFKILHWELGPLNGGILLAVGTYYRGNHISQFLPLSL